MATYNTSEVSKKALIAAAGELFAERGVSGTNLRAIAQKAGLNVALIKYHFGSKEGLVNAVIDFVLDAYKEYSPEAYIKEHKELMNTREGQIKMVLYTIDQAFEFMHPRPDNLWINTFLTRCAQSNELGKARVLDQILIPGCVRYSKLYSKITGDTNYQTARCWALSVFAPAFIYAVNPQIINDTYPGKKVKSNFYEDLKNYSIQVALTGLGLKPNKRLKKTKHELEQIEKENNNIKG